MSKTFTRMLRHIFTAESCARKIFNPTLLQAIENQITAGEQQHGAELQWVVESALSAHDVLLHILPRNRAHVLFSTLRVWDTEHNSGVLIYVNLADRKVEIVADRGVGRALTPAQWGQVCQMMTHYFRVDQFHEGSVAGLKELNQLLTQHYPNMGARKENELSNRPLVLG